MLLSIAETRIHSAQQGPFQAGVLIIPPAPDQINSTAVRATMTRFRPCIDLHSGQVKQIVGGTLSSSSSELRTNHISPHPAKYFAELYRKHEVSGGHVIMLGPGNEEAAIEALSVWPQGLQVGGGINAENARLWIERSAHKVG